VRQDHLLPSTKGAIWQDPRTEQKESSMASVQRCGMGRIQKKDLVNPYRISGQFQQNLPLVRGHIQKSWFLYGLNPASQTLFRLFIVGYGLDDGENCAYSALYDYCIFQTAGRSIAYIAGLLAREAGNIQI